MGKITKELCKKMIKIYDKKILEEKNILKNLSKIDKKKAQLRIEAFYFGKKQWKNYLKKFYKKS